MASPNDNGHEHQGPVAAREKSKTHTTKRRHANLYDAVAGRMTAEDPLLALRSRASRVTPNRSGFYKLHDSTLAPEEVLFRRRAAPLRYAEKDIYFQNEQQPQTGTRRHPGSDLPESDLLKAVHTYSSRFYEELGKSGDGDEATGSASESSVRPRPQRQCFVGSRHIDERSMDETALIAFGILLEEAGREVLGRRGDLVFSEGLDHVAVDAGPAVHADGADSETGGGDEGGDGGQGTRGLRVSSRLVEVAVGPVDGESSWRKNYPKHIKYPRQVKRRRLNDHSGVSRG